MLPGNTATLGGAPMGTFPGLLTSQSLLGGEQQTVTYEPLRMISSTIPAAAWVASTIQTTNGISGGPFASLATVTYSYVAPVYDPRDSQFVGFGAVTETHQGDLGAPGLVRFTQYATTACGPASGTSCTGQVDYGWFRTLRGVPLYVSDSDTTGSPQKEVVNNYTETMLYTGIDGRVVRQLMKTGETDYAWDPGDPSTQSQTIQLFSGLGASSYEAYTASLPTTVTLPNLDPIRVQSWQQTLLGDFRVAIDFGDPDFDTPIRTESTYALSGGDTTGWSYRPVVQNVGYTVDSTGASIASPPARPYSYTYDALGRLLTKTAALANEPAPPNASNGFAAGAPLDASNSGAVCVVGCSLGGIQYDAYGNATAVPTANNRCTGTTFDPLFAQYAQAHYAYQGGCGSTNPVPMSPRPSMTVRSSR